MSLHNSNPDSKALPPDKKKGANASGGEQDRIKELLKELEINELEKEQQSLDGDDGSSHRKRISFEIGQHIKAKRKKAPGTDSFLGDHAEEIQMPQETVVEEETEAKPLPTVKINLHLTDSEAEKSPAPQQEPTEESEKYLFSELPDYDPDGAVPPRNDLNRFDPVDKEPEPVPEPANPVEGGNGWQPELLERNKPVSDLEADKQYDVEIDVKADLNSFLEQALREKKESAAQEMPEEPSDVPLELQQEILNINESFEHEKADILSLLHEAVPHGEEEEAAAAMAGAQVWEMESEPKEYLSSDAHSAAIAAEDLFPQGEPLGESDSTPGLFFAGSDEESGLLRNQEDVSPEDELVTPLFSQGASEEADLQELLKIINMASEQQAEEEDSAPPVESAETSASLNSSESEELNFEELLKIINMAPEEHFGENDVLSLDHADDAAFDDHSWEDTHDEAAHSDVVSALEVNPRDEEMALLELINDTKDLEAELMKIMREAEGEPVERMPAQALPVSEQEEKDTGGPWYLVNDKLLSEKEYQAFVREAKQQECESILVDDFEEEEFDDESDMEDGLFADMRTQVEERLFSQLKDQLRDEELLLPRHSDILDDLKKGPSVNETEWKNELRDLVKEAITQSIGQITSELLTKPEAQAPQPPQAPPPQAVVEDDDEESLSPLRGDNAVIVWDEPEADATPAQEEPKARQAAMDLGIKFDSALQESGQASSIPRIMPPGVSFPRSQYYYPPAEARDKKEGPVKKIFVSVKDAVNGIFE